MPTASIRQAVTLAINPALYGPHDLPVVRTLNTGTPNTPVRRRVRLHNQRSGRLIQEVWSQAATGEALFLRLLPGIYYVISFDHTGAYGAESESDIVVPAP
ncbi:MAG: hypothetical protein ACK40L_04930 [Hydrogenophaga sp.]